MTATSREELQKAIDAFHLFGSKKEAAISLGLNYTTYKSRITTAENLKIKPKITAVSALKKSKIEDELAEAKNKIRELETSAKLQKQDELTAEFVKRKIIKLASLSPNPPKWLSKKSNSKNFAGVPTIFASDWHWGEVVDPNQINGVNEYNLGIAQQRARHMIEKSIQLLKNHVSNADYPGVVYVLGGDMVSGGIHEELLATDEKEIMPVVLDLFGVLIWCIDTLANEFGHVFVPCVSGNHGRSTHKIRNKGRNYTSFDWLLYQFLAKHFEGDKRVQFLIPDGPDAYYSIFGHRYLLTHGDQFRGGDSLIGALGPLIRGDHRKRSRNAQIDMSYDTMLCGHWHQLIQLERLIVNGSLKGYCEYAYSNNFGFEPPRQAMWITHPDHGITFSIPLYVDKEVQKKDSIQKGEWISWK